LVNPGSAPSPPPPPPVPQAAAGGVPVSGCTGAAALRHLPAAGPAPAAAGVPGVRMGGRGGGGGCRMSGVKPAAAGIPGVRQEGGAGGVKSAVARASVEGEDQLAQAAIGTSGVMWEEGGLQNGFARNNSDQQYGVCLHVTHGFNRLSNRVSLHLQHSTCTYPPLKVCLHLLHSSAAVSSRLIAWCTCCTAFTCCC
jgi:hypothetical protein